MAASLSYGIHFLPGRCKPIVAALTAVSLVTFVRLLAPGTGFIGMYACRDCFYVVWMIPAPACGAETAR